jgi:hypothetical protein
MTVADFTTSDEVLEQLSPSEREQLQAEMRAVCQITASVIIDAVERYGTALDELDEALTTERLAQLREFGAELGVELIRVSRALRRYLPFFAALAPQANPRGAQTFLRELAHSLLVLHELPELPDGDPGRHAAVCEVIISRRLLAARLSSGYLSEWLTEHATTAHEAYA